MENSFSSIFGVKIDFSQSHMIFPSIIMWFMAFLLVLILFLNGRKFFYEVKTGKRKLKFFVENYDKIRLFGTLFVVPIYFYLMEFVGSFFPNLGLGFFLVSIPFMLIISFMYVHHLTRPKAVVIGLNSVIAPGVAWYVLGYLFNITLP